MLHSERETVTQESSNILFSSPTRLLPLQQPGMSQVRPPMMGAQQPMVPGMAPMQPNPSQNPQGVLDPFGAL